MSSPAASFEAPAGLGEQFLAEIHEQPRALEGLLAQEREFARVAEVVRERGVSLVRMVGHGSSDNAASYGVYTFGHSRRRGHDLQGDRPRRRSQAPLTRCAPTRELEG